MSTKIVFNYADIKNSVNKINQYAQDLQTAGTTFIQNVNSAIEGADGVSMQKFNNLMNGSVNKYVTTEIPKTIQQVAEVLQKNAEAMQQSDEDVSKAIPDSL